MAAKCFEDTPCAPKFIRYASLWGRSGPYSRMCSSCMFIQPFHSQPDSAFPLFFQHFAYISIFLHCAFHLKMQVMQELGLIGLRIQRMPSEPDLEFGIPSQYSYMTVRVNITNDFHCTHYMSISYFCLCCIVCEDTRIVYFI